MEDAAGAAATTTLLGDRADVADLLHPFWHKFPVLPPWLYYLMGFLWTLGGLFSLLGNGLVMYLFTKSRKLRSPSNFLVVNLAFCDFMIMATLVPEFIVNCASGGTWRFGSVACVVHAFCGALFGYAQIVTLVFVSYDRFQVIVKGFTARPLTYLRVATIVAFVYAYSAAWAIAPLYGFGAYALDGILTDFDYVSRDWVNVTFMWAVCGSTYALPLAVILFAYFHIVKAVILHERGLREQAKKMNVVSLRSGGDLHSEIKIAKVAMLNVSLWTIAWTPFTVICLIGVSGDQSVLTPLIGSLSVIFAKTSCLYNPIVYAISHPKYQQVLKKEVPWVWPGSVTSSDHQDDSTHSDVTTKEQSEQITKV